MQARFTTAVLLGFILVGAAACGGGGGDDDAQLRTDLEAAQEAAQEAEEARKRAEAEAAEAERKRREAEAEAEQARQDTQDAADAEAARQAAEAARQAAEAAQRQAEQEQEELQQQLTEAQQAELRARASSFGATLDLGTGGGDEEAMATVSWPRGGSLTFRPSGVTHTRGSAAPSVPGGWTNTASFTGQIGTASTALTDETVYLYTNIQRAGNRAFWKKYGGDDLTITQQQVTDGLVNPSTSVSRTRQDPSDSTTPFVSARAGGTYDGVSGNFSCTGDETACTVTRADGATTIGGTWTFKATNLTSPAPVDHDDAYLYFGIWSSIPDNISGTTYNFRYVAGGGAQSGGDLTGFDTLTGSATYSGGAVGKYVTQGQVGQQNAKIGTFTATATLNVDFGANDAAGTLSGSITNFQEDGSALAGWRVTLGSTADVGVASTIASGAAAGSTVANIGGLPVGGSWGATFHGSSNVITGLDDRDKYPAVDIGGVTGWFDATGADASLAGAFAATP